jgi:HlyD family secretion protein
MKGHGSKIIKLVSNPTSNPTGTEGRAGYICYVDDSRTSAYVTKKILKDYGYKVDHFPSAEPAVVSILENDYDLLLTDLTLSSGGMDGDDLIRFLRKSGHPRKKLIPVIVITGTSEKEVLLRIYEAGANGVLVKPITGEELNERIRSLVPEKALGGQDYALEIHDPAQSADDSSKGQKNKPDMTQRPNSPSAAAKNAVSNAIKKKTVVKEGATTAQVKDRLPKTGASAFKKPELPLNTKPVDGQKQKPQDAVSGVVRNAVQELGDDIVGLNSKGKTQAPPSMPDQMAGSAAGKASAKDVIANLRAQAKAEAEKDNIPVLTIDEHKQKAKSEKGFGEEEINLGFGDDSEKEPELDFSDLDLDLEVTGGVEDKSRQAPKESNKPKAYKKKATAELNAKDTAAKQADAGAGEGVAPESESFAPPPDATGGEKKIITALDINTDFSDFQDDLYKPSAKDAFIDALKRYKLLGLAALVSLFIIFGGVWNFFTAGSALPVETVKVAMGSLHQSINVPGKIVSKLKVDVSTSSPGQIVSVEIKEGEKVSKGQVLARMENEEALSEVKRAEGNLLSTQEETALANKTLKRMRRALNLGAISRQQVEEAEASLKSARAKEAVAREELRSAKLALDKLKVTAPFAGTVTAKYAQVGQWVSPAEPLFTLVDLGQREVEAQVDSADASAISVGQQVFLSSDAFPDQTWEEKVIRIAPATDREQRSNSVAVYVSLGEKAPELRFGQQVDVEIRTFSSRRTPKLPLRALITRNGKTWVGTIDENRVHFVQVETGMEDLTHVEILNGVKTGQAVIIPKGEALQEGDPVRVTATQPTE